MALSARHVAFVKSPPGGSRAALAVYYYEPLLDEQQSSLLGYVPYRWTMQDLYALLTAGTIGAVGGSLAAVLQMSACKTGSQNGGMGERLRRMRLSNRFLAIFHALLLAILAIGFALSWSTYEQGRGAHFRYLNDGGAYPWNFERWNYAVAWSLDPSRLAVSRSTLLGLCQQAWAARVLILCAFTLAGLALAVQLSAWRQHGRDQAWRGQSHGGERSSQASTIAVKENGVEAVSLGEQTPSEAEARGDARN